MREIDELLRQYLRRVSTMLEAHHRERPYPGLYSSYEQLVLRQGRAWEAQALPPEAERGSMRYCYFNTLQLTAERPELRYTEGYAIPCVDGQALIPVQHAWAVLPIEQSAVALMWTPAEHILRHVAVRAEDLEVIAFRLPGNAFVEACVLVPTDAQGSAMRGAIAVDVIERQKLEGLFATADTAATVEGHDLLSGLAAALGAPEAGATARGFKIARATLASVDSLCFETGGAARAALGTRTSPAVVTDTGLLRSSSGSPIALPTATTGLEGRGWRVLASAGSTLVVHPDILAEQTGMRRWPVRDTGKVWDSTWPEPEASAYYGLVFDRTDVARFLEISEDCWGILPTEYLVGFPLLRSGQLFPPEDSERDELIVGSDDWRRNFFAAGYHEGVTCDWGDCNELAVTLRNSRADVDWLPVCEQHRLWKGRTADGAEAARG